MKHAVAQHWWKRQHNASKGYGNYTEIRNNLGDANVQVNVVSAASVVEEFASNGTEESTSGIMEEFLDNVCLYNTSMSHLF